MNQILKFIVLDLIILFGSIELINGHTYKLGSCPSIKPVQHFDINKFLGKWYVVRKTATGSHCLLYNFNRTENPKEFVIDQYSQHFILGHTPVTHIYQYEGRLNILDDQTAGHMTINFPMNVAGNASYVVFYADDSIADNYIDIPTDTASRGGSSYDFVALYTCQKLAFAHRESTTILSRSKEIDSKKLNEIISLMKNYEINPYDLSIISQTNCPNYFDGAERLLNIKIDDHTFTAHSAANVVRKIGYKLGDGIEYTGSITKYLYDKLLGAYKFFKDYVF